MNYGTIELGEHMKKKGFTLVELLAVIVILGVISLIVFPTVMNSIHKSKQNLYKIQVQDIEKAGKKWINEHMEYLDDSHLNTIGVSLSSLIESGYLQKNDILDPRDKSRMNGCVTIIYDDTISQYQYHYVESSCAEAVTNGMIYSYENNTWNMIEKNVRKLASSTIIAQYVDNNILKVDGQTDDGFYDEGDRYIYRGTDVNNYAKLSGGTETYRILSIEKTTGHIRLMGTTSIPNVWDSNNTTTFENASVTTVQLESYYNSTSNGITTNASKIVTDALWNTGNIVEDSSYLVLKNLEADRTAYGKIGLPSISDYVGASTEPTCHSSILSESCKQHNYLSELWKGKNNWLINTDGTSIWYVDANGSLNRSNANTIYNIYPVIEIKNVYIENGIGTSVSPYIFK